MRSRARAAEESIATLLESGIQGQIRDGDQLGVWTFNNDLHDGEFDLVVWNESVREEISRSIVGFLDKQRFRKSTDFSKVMPHLLDVVAESKRITVILVSDGDEAIQGTPFDDDIAAYYRENAKAIKDKRAPIITVLRGHEGVLIGHNVSYPPWPIEFPAFPPEPERESGAGAESGSESESELEHVVATTNVVSGPLDLSRTLATTNKGPIVFAEPLIVSGFSRDNRVTAGSQDETNGLTGVGSATFNAADQSNVVSSTSEVVNIPPESMPDPQPQDADREHRRFSWTYVIIPAFGVVALAAGVAGVMRMRRSRSRQHASLITRSMNRKSGPK
jgi:hypothetical protein